MHTSTRHDSAARARFGPVLVCTAVGLSATLVSPATLQGQWTNRYPRVTGYSHHVYLEGYELPQFTVGPIDPAPHDDGIAFASEGWIWLLHPSTGSARRLTSAGGMDSRPAWSPDGAFLAMVRDDSRETTIVERTQADGSERTLVAEAAINLDPAYSHDGRHLYYSSAAAGDLDLWRLERSTGQAERITTEAGLERRPLLHPDGRRLVYLAKTRGGGDQIRIRALADGTEAVLYRGSILSQVHPALSPDGATVAFNVPDGRGGWELRTLSVDRPGPTTLITAGGGLPLTPAWSPDGAWIYFSEPTPDERMALYRVRSAGGPVESVPVRTWDRGATTGRLRIRTTTRGVLAAARLGVSDADGHPAVPPGAKPFFDGQTGRVFFYGDGVVELEVPAGRYSVTGARGLATPVSQGSADVPPGGSAEVRLALDPVWDAREEGWLSGDHHFHLNYGGPYQLEPSDLADFMLGEDLDVGAPLLANLHNRFEQQELWGQGRLGSLPWIQFGQEVRSHFLGHVSLLNIQDLFWPWVWGPGYQVYGRDDRTNATALDHARAQGGLNTYVHPVNTPDPFASDPPTGIPVSLVADAVQGHLDGLEIVCLWSNDAGTTELWYRLLNVGIPVVPTAGTDVMTDLYRTMAVGTTRVYVQTGGSLAFGDYMDALRSGRSVVTTGPMLDFRLDGIGPGGSVDGGGATPWSLDLHSATPTGPVEVVVNGVVVWSEAGLNEAGSRSYSGTVDVPDGGWVAVRTDGPPIDDWPGMGTHSFAHTAPVWLGVVGSTDPATRRTSAQDLLRALDGAEARLEAGYGATPIPRLLGHFDAARQVLQAWIR